MAEVTFKFRTNRRYPVVILLGDQAWWSWSAGGWVLEPSDTRSPGWRRWPNVRG